MKNTKIHESIKKISNTKKNIMDEVSLVVYLMQIYLCFLIIRIWSELIFTKFYLLLSSILTIALESHSFCRFICLSQYFIATLESRKFVIFPALLHPSIRGNFCTHYWVFTSKNKLSSICICHFIMFLSSQVFLSIIRRLPNYCVFIKMYGCY